ncbi:MAG TPA: hypothetical protein PLN92_10015 [Thermotogota bacterium]|nr:hypothetical protein [Thermotogota bacterium]
MKKALILLSLLFITNMMYSMNVILINEYLYPVDQLKKVDTAIETVRCVDIVDTNTIKVKYENLDKEVLVTFLGIEEYEDEMYSGLIIDMNKRKLVGKKLFLSYDWKARNEKDEILAYIWLPTYTEVGGYDILWNEILLLNGYGEMSSSSLQLQRSILFFQSFQYAQDNKLGIWKKIETKEPLQFAELPEEIQNYIIEKYEQGFEKTQQNATTDSATNTVATDSQTINEFLKMLMLGAEWGMIPAALEQSVTARKVSGRYEGSLLEQSWNFDFNFKTLYGEGENLGMTVRRLTSIEYRLRGDYDSNQRFEIFEKIKDQFLMKFGEASEVIKATNNYEWELPEQNVMIRLYPSNYYPYGMFYINFTGELEF